MTPAARETRGLPPSLAREQSGRLAMRLPTS